MRFLEKQEIVRAKNIFFRALSVTKLYNEVTNCKRGAPSRKTSLWLPGE
jgi:hypothetical protein